MLLKTWRVKGHQLGQPGKLHLWPIHSMARIGRKGSGTKVPYTWRHGVCGDRNIDGHQTLARTGLVEDLRDSVRSVAQQHGNGSQACSHAQTRPSARGADSSMCYQEASQRRHGQFRPCKRAVATISNSRNSTPVTTLAPMMALPRNWMATLGMDTSNANISYCMARCGLDHGALPCAVLDNVRPGFSAVRATARSSRLLVHDSMRTIRCRSRRSSATMKPSAPAGVTT